MMLTPFESAALVLSLKVSLLAILISLPLAIGTAYALARYEFRGKAVLNTLIHAPLVLPPVVVGYVLLLAFGRGTALGRWFNDSLGLELAFTWRGAAIAAAVMAFPLIVRAVRLSIEAIDSRLDAAARTLGASPGRVFRTITLPLALPGILTGTLLGFARALGEFGATITFVANIPELTQTLPLALYSAIQTPGGDPVALRLVLLSLVLAFAAMALAEYLARRVHERLA